MPVYLRKNWIETHNYMEELQRQQTERETKKENTITGEATNKYL